MESFVTFKDEVPSSGVIKPLSNEQEMLYGDTIFNMKRLIGRVDTDPVVRASKYLPFLVQTLDIGVQPYIAALVNNVWRATTLEEALAMILMDLRVMTKTHLKGPIKDAVLTVPDDARTNSSGICRLQQQKASQKSMGSGSEKIALIFNIGACFCDVAVTATGGGVSQIKALAGSTIGGEDLLQNIMRHLLLDFETTFKNRGIKEIESIALLRVATQDAIHQLSSLTSVQVNVELGDGLKVYKVVDSAEFEKVNKEVFEKCESLVI
ncbi:hypothetical protein KIW84_046434 [Lathyrus oleraceus]|uniref:Uncharacterized protein n=1 Tax=Pisum sativum TaxID=3888 RepID=A0A9D5AVJ2_PEA|nr:hypothetical protein KIW84_046434 [Pisum sativum]